MTSLADVNVNNPNGFQAEGIGVLIIAVLVAIFILWAAWHDKSWFAAGIGFAILGAAVAALEGLWSLIAFMWIGIILAIIGIIMAIVDKLQE
jgi:hypothetical protein